MEHGMNPGEPDLGVAPIGTLRPLIGSFTDGRKSTVLSHCWSHDRTLKEWFELIEEHKRCPFPSSLWRFPLTEHHGSWMDWTKTGAEIETFFYQNQRMRWIVRKWIARIRHRICKRRVVNTEDLYTVQPIHPRNLVVLLDTKCRSTYQFHTNTLLQIFMRHLTYSSYGFAEPHTPKNPYTNVPLTLGQLISVVSQMSANLAYQHKFIPALLVAYRYCGYDVKRFFLEKKSSLCITAAVNFFKAEDADAKEMLLEAFDTLEEYFSEKPVGLSIIRTLLQRKQTAYYEQWVELLTAFWIYQHYRIFYKYSTIENLRVQYDQLAVDTFRAYRRAHPRIHRVRQITVIAIAENNHLV